MAGAALLAGEAVDAEAVLVAAGRGEVSHGEDADVELGAAPASTTATAAAAAAAAAARVAGLAGVVGRAVAAAVAARAGRRLRGGAVVLAVVAAIAGRVVVGVGFHAGLGWRLERIPLRIVGHDEELRARSERCQSGRTLAADTP